MASFQPQYSPWRHGGWYVDNVIYPSGACGCVSRNYEDKKWRIVCDDRRKEYQGEGDFTYPNRDAAARAEYDIATLQAEIAAKEAGWEEAGGSYRGKVVRTTHADETADFHFAGQDCVLADNWGAACIRDRNRLTLARSRAKAEGREG